MDTVKEGMALQPDVEPYPGYRLVQQLGHGAFAQVWEAEKAGGSRVALKFLDGQKSTTTTRELRAIQTVRQLPHPGLVRIENVWHHLGYVVVAMELADGSLLDLLEAHQEEFGSPIPPRQLCRLLAQAAAALDFLNTRQHLLGGQRVAIQHCDVKPSNLLLFDERIKLADFGLSSQTSSSLQFHRRAGTLDYTAPEVFQGRLSDQTDQYSLAVTYCQLRGGRLPFPFSPQNYDRSYVRPTPELSMLPPRERPVIARALAPVPPERWPSCQELVAQLAWVMS